MAIENKYADHLAGTVDIDTALGVLRTYWDAFEANMNQPCPRRPWHVPGSQAALAFEQRVSQDCGVLGACFLVGRCAGVIRAGSPQKMASARALGHEGTDRGREVDRVRAEQPRQLDVRLDGEVVLKPVWLNPATKLDRIRALDARLELVDGDFDPARERAAALAQHHNIRLVEDAMTSHSRQV